MGKWRWTLTLKKKTLNQVCAAMLELDSDHKEVVNVFNCLN